MKISTTVLVVIFVIVTSCAVEGASWKLFNENKSQINVINIGFKNYIDTESIVANSVNIVRAWRRILTYSSETDLLSDYHLIEMNCQERQYRIIEAYRVVHDSSVIKVPKDQEEINKVNYLKPEEYDEKLYKTWCVDNILKNELVKDNNNNNKKKKRL